nr:hypothetical protein [Tanacetum cinerariifolium]
MELMELCTNLSNKVLELESDVIDIKSTYQERIHKLKGRVERLEEENKVLKELKSVHSIDDVVESVMEKFGSLSKKVLSMMDVNKEEPADVEEVLEGVKVAKLMTEVVTTARATKVSVPRKRRGVIILDPKESTTTATVQPKELKSVHSIDDVVEPIMEKFGSLSKKVLSMMDVNKEEPADVEEVLEGVKVAKLMTEVVTTARATKVSVPRKRRESSKREGKSLEQEIAKKQRMEEETKELKKHLQIVTDDDDVYTDATPLASKIPIVDYKIHTERNRHYFKIIRADGNHMMFISLSTMLKNFDREDLESLWIIVRDRFKKTKPKNYSNDYLLNTLKIMFEKPNVEAKIFLFGERMYLLIHFTLEQMLNNVRLQVEDESEMSLEILRLVKRQLNEG